MFHSTDVSPALGNITPKQTTEPDKTSHNSILKSVLTVIRYICFLPYPYLLTVLANFILVSSLPLCFLYRFVSFVPERGWLEVY